MTTYDPLIYGKNPLERIVSIEPKDEFAEVFLQQEDGTVKSEFIKNRYWILSNKRLDSKFIQLKGDQHYKYGKQFSLRDDYERDRGMYKYRNDIYAIYEPRESLMVKDGVSYFKGLNVNDLTLLSFDLETTSLDPMTKEAKILLISNTYKFKDKVIKRLFAYDEYETQGEMIKDWCKFIRDLDPSILLGHNIYGFDFKYLKGIADKEGIQLELGRDGSPAIFDQYESKFRKEASQFIHYNKIRVYGREIIDTLFLSLKHDQASRKYESYGLKQIIKQEGLEKEDRVFYDANLIRHNYLNKEEWKKIKDYCRDDADDSLKLFELMIPPYFYMTQSVPKSFSEMLLSASGSQINSMMVRAYLQQGHSIAKASEAEDYVGAISFGVPGRYKNLLKIDFSSLYPSIMRQYKVHDNKKDINGYFLKMTEYFAIERLKNKKLFKETNIATYDYLQSSQKIFSNSMYGALGAPGLNYNSPKSAAFITETGRELLKFSIKWATGKDYEYWKQKFDENT